MNTECPPYVRHYSGNWEQTDKKGKHHPLAYWQRQTLKKQIRKPVISDMLSSRKKIKWDKDLAGDSPPSVSDGS